MTDEVQFWKQQVLTRNRDQLTSVSRAATAWSAVFTAVLGVFSTVSFAGGFSSIDHLAAPWSGPVKAATVVAVVLALAATVLAGSASGTSVSVTDDSTWDGQRAWVKTQAMTAYQRLRLAKRVGAGAGAVLLFTAMVVLLAGKTDPAPPTVIAVVGGRAVCGPLASGEGGVLSVAGTALVKVTSLTVVPTCP